MRKHVVTAQPDAVVDEVASELSDSKVGCVVVVREDKSIGIVTDRDISVGFDANWVDTSLMTFGEMIDGDVVSVDTDTGLVAVSELMNDRSDCRLPVIVDGGLVGIVRQDDLVVYVADILQNLAGIVRTESPPEF